MVAMVADHLLESGLAHNYPNGTRSENLQNLSDVADLTFFNGIAAVHSWESQIPMRARIT
jgi:hypothetical protein